MSYSFSVGSASIVMDGIAGVDFGRLVQTLDFGSGAKSDLPRLANTTTGQPRTFGFTAYVAAASKDLLNAAISVINAQLAVPNTATILQEGASHSVTLRTFPSGGVQISGDAGGDGYEIAGWTCCKIALVCEPYAYGAEETVAADVTTPGYLSLAALSGEYPGPLSLTVARKTGAQEIHGVWLGKVIGTCTSHLVTAHSLTWANAAAHVVDATAVGGYYVTASGATSTTTTVDTAAYPAGTYLLLAKMKVIADAGGTVYADTAASPWKAAVPAAETRWRWYELGELCLPYALVKSGASNMPLGVACSAGSHLAICALAFVPVSAGYSRWLGSVDATHNDTILFDYDGMVYGEGAPVLPGAAGAPIRAVGGSLFVVVDDDTGALPAMAVSVTAKTYPRFNLYR